MKELKEKISLSDVQIKKDINIEIDNICKALEISKNLFVQTILENEARKYAKKLKI
jgi:riboflavin synthase alpha subunit